MPLEGLSAGVRATDDSVQPVQPLVAAGSLASNSQGPVRRAMDHRRRGDGRQLREGSSVRPRRKRGAKKQAIGISRGGQTTKIHALSDTLGRPVVLKVTAGNVADITMAGTLLAEVRGCRHVLADKGYDSDKLRAVIRDKGARPVIPGRSSRKRKVRFDKSRYRFRWTVEAVFCRLKDFRRVATRYDKLARNYEATLAIATIVAYWL
jgi:transposase